MQEWQVAEPLAQPIITHGRVRIDVLFLRQPSQRSLLVADLVDELEPHTLASGEDTTVGHALKVRVIEVAARLHHVAKPGVGIRHDGLDRRARLRRGRLEAVGCGLERRGFDLFDLDADRLQEVGDVGILEQHADRAHERGFHRDDVIGGDRRNVAARCRNPVDHHDQRLLRLEPRLGIVQLLRAGCRAPGAVDVHDHRAGARFPHPLQRLDPLPVEPYWAIASFSSATSSALMETCTLRVRRSNWVTRASTFCPGEKRSGRCSPRSRASSERLMNVVKSVPTIFTSIPPSFTSVTSEVTTAPFLSSAALSRGSPASCLMPSEMRSFSTSTSSTLALTLSPFLYSSITCSPGRFQSRSERWTMPSTSPSRPRNSPNSVLFLTSPSITAPGGYFSTKASHGLRMVCLRPSEMRRLTGSTSRICTSTSWEVDTILPGCTFFFVHDISET